MTDPDSLLLAIQRLFALLDEREVEYVLVGGIALLSYVEGRNTQDIDLIMTASSLERLPEIQTTKAELDFITGKFEGLRIDVLLSQNPLFAEVQRNYTIWRQFQERKIPTATIEGLLLLKLYALPSLYRQGDFVKVGLYENDIATLMHYYQPRVGDLIDILGKYLADSDIAELKGIVTEIEGRLKRFRKD